MSTQPKPEGNYDTAEKKFAAMRNGPNACIFTDKWPRTPSQMNHDAYFRALWQMVKDHKGEWAFLELGSGRGTTSQYLAYHGVPTGNIALLDMCQLGLEMAAENFRAWNLPQPQLFRGDAAHSGFADEQFDCIYNVGLLEHFADPKTVLREANRLLKPGGLIFMVNVGGANHSGWGDFRTNNPCEYFVQCMKEVGCDGAICVPFQFPNVSVLSYWKPTA